ncbi:HD domain-containing protein [Roseovarius sp. ZX-A-9]|uniref:HD domain-containing protein n=1 Tax=Roseovarius sp. ZX-A-9 TaxID=3014783 RepID=UPI00233038BA|nr:HD domain-containing protein [Roseovarius sp. ZX-A-9]
MLDEMGGHRIETHPSDACELMPLAAAEATFRSDEAISFDDPFALELMSTAPLRRLAGIGFLGAIDFMRHGSGRSAHRRRHNRLEHTLGVARLADTYAREAGLCQQRRRLLVAAALLHDVGHGPLSHTLEPVFAEAFDVDHHSMTRRIVLGETRSGRAVYASLRGANLDPDEVLAMIDGHHDGPDAFLFAGSINFDTLDGIARSRAFMEPRAAPLAMLRAVRRWAQTGHAPLSQFDAFWTLKHDVYTLLIGGARGRLLDAIAQAYMRANIDAFDATDFERSEGTLRKRHPQLFDVLGRVADRRSSLKDYLPGNWMKGEVMVKDRAFTVCTDSELDEPGQLDARYTQTKSTRRVSIEELVEAL